MFEIVDAPDDPPLRPVLRPRPERGESSAEHHVQDDADAPHVGRGGGVRAAHHLERVNVKSRNLERPFSHYTLNVLLRIAEQEGMRLQVARYQVNSMP